MVETFVKKNIPTSFSHGRMLTPSFASHVLYPATSRAWNRDILPPWPFRRSFWAQDGTGAAVGLVTDNLVRVNILLKLHEITRNIL